MRNGALLYLACAAVCFGIALTLLMQPPAWAAFVVLFAAAASCVFGMLWKKPAAIFACAALAALSLGMLRADMVLRGERAETLPQYAGEPVTLTGRVAEDPDLRDTSLHVVVEAKTVDGTPARGKALVLLPREERLSYNDTVEVHGSLQAPQPFQTETDHTFDYPGFLRARGISMQMGQAALVADSPGPWSLAGSLFALKHVFERSLARLLPEPDNALMQGLLVGERGGIPKGVTNDFVKSGLVHIVALSGYNVSIVAEGVFRALAFLPRAANFSLGGLAMVLFTIMTGSGAATVRALLMALVAIFARYLRRPVLALRSLSLAGVVMVLWNPEGLLHDTSFTLSMLATFGLVTLSPWVEMQLAKLRLFRHRRMLSTRSVVATTLGVELFVLPMLLFTSGMLSLVSVFANALVLPVIPAAMLCGFVTGVLGFISPSLGLLPALLSDLILKWILFVTATTASVPLGTLIVGEFPPLILAITYVPLVWFSLSVLRKSMVNTNKR